MLPSRVETNPETYPGPRTTLVRAGWNPVSGVGSIRRAAGKTAIASGAEWHLETPGVSESRAWRLLQLSQRLYSFADAGIHGFSCCGQR